MNQVPEMTVDGRTYQIGKLNALQQFHLTRRLGPVLVVAGISLDMLRKGMKVDIGDLVAIAGPVMDIVSRMSDEDSEYIVFMCLGVCRMKQGDSWAPLLSPESKQLMFQNMEMPEMLRVALEVIKVNLGNFLTGLGDELTSQSSLGQGQQTSSQ